MPRSPRADGTLGVALLRRRPLPADDGDDKRGRGTVLVAGGAVTTPGAAMLAGIAALRVGAGRLQIATAPAAAATLAPAVPEAWVGSWEDGDFAQRVADADAVVIGPGLDDLDTAGDLLRTVIGEASSDAVVVVDALALTAMSKLGVSTAGRRQVIITPNREELAELASTVGSDAVEADVARSLGVTVVSFGCVAAADGAVWRQDEPVLGLGTSGAGDVLAGAAGGLGARCGDATTAACWATLAHRVAASRLARSVGPVGYLARELAGELPRALVDLR